jgi:hypothetical protein
MNIKKPKNFQQYCLKRNSHDEYLRRLELQCNEILSPKIDELSKDELGVIYNVKKVDMPLKMPKLGAKLFKNRLEKIRRRLAHRKKDLEQIEELSEEE